MELSVFSSDSDSDLEVLAELSGWDTDSDSSDVGSAPSRRKRRVNYMQSLEDAEFTFRFRLNKPAVISLLSEIMPFIRVTSTSEDIMLVRELSPELAEKARVELNEDPIRMKDDLKYIKNWLNKQPHIHARTDDQWLAAFLRGCKFSLERVKEKLDFHYTVRNTAKDLFRIRHTDALFTEIIDLGCVLILPKLSGPSEPRVAIVRPGRYDPSKYTVSDIISASNILQKIIMMEDDNCIIAGIRAVLDLEGVTLGHFVQMTPIQMKKLVISLQDVNPFRMKGTHYINVPPGFEMFLNAIKSLLNEKSRSRLFVHNRNYKDMYKYIPQEILPTEYGGTGGTIKGISDYWKKRVESYADWLEEDLQYGTDESKRPGKPKTAADLFGTEGSFRQLQVD